MRVHNANDKTVVLVTAPYIDHIRQLFYRFEPELNQNANSQYEFVASEDPSGQNQTVQDACHLVSAMEEGTRFFFATAMSAYKLIDVAKAAKEKGFPICVVNDEAHYSSQEDSGPMQLTRMVEAEKGDRGIVATATPDGNVMKIPNIIRTLWLGLDSAIEQRYCSEYRIVVPLMYHKDDRIDDVTNSKVYLPVAIKELMKGHDINAAAIFTVNGMWRDGGRRCIAYVDSKSEASRAEKALQGACKALAMSCWTSVITDEVKTSERKEAYKQFATGSICDTKDGDNNSEPMERPKLRFLIAVKILDQCVDIPETDTIAIMKTPAASGVESAHRAIQRGGRSMRPKPDPRISHWYIFCEHSDSAKDGKGASAWFNMFLATLAEYDPGVPRRVSVRSSNPVSALAKETLELEAVELSKTMEKYEIYCKTVTLATTDKRFEWMLKINGKCDEKECQKMFSKGNVCDVRKYVEVEDSVNPKVDFGAFLNNVCKKNKDEYWERMKKSGGYLAKRVAQWENGLKSASTDNPEENGDSVPKKNNNNSLGKK